MKTVLSLAAATMFTATTAFAQTAAPGTMGPSTGTPPAESSAPSTSTPAAPDSTMAPATAPSNSMASSDGLTQGADGKWMMGDRPATKAEIKAHNKMSSPK